DSRVREMAHGDGQPERRRRDADPLGQLADGELLGELVEDAVLAGRGRVRDGELDAAHGVADVEAAARLPSTAADREGMADRGLDVEPVQGGPEDAVVVEAVDQPGVAGDLRGEGAVDDALIQVR